MDAPEELGRRGRRALPLIAGALTAMVVAGLIYLHPAFPSLPKAPPPPSPSVISSDSGALYDFLSATTGWALVLGPPSGPARSFVYRTTDGAKHWNLQLTTYSATTGAAMIQFFDSKRGVIAMGNPGQLYRTSDAGTHWNSVPLPPYEANEIVFSDPSHGWLLASQPDPNLQPNAAGSTGQLGHFFATTDGGSTWTELAWPWASVNGFAGVQFRRPGDGWRGTGASEPTVYSTVDGGASWQPHALPLNSQANPVPASKSDFAFNTFVNLLPGAGVLAIISYRESVAYSSPTFNAYTSFDGGTTWRSVEPPPDSTAWDFAYQDSSHWWAMPPGTLWKSSYAGRSWQRVSQQVDYWVYRPQIIDAKHAWAVLYPLNGKPGTGLAMTSDGGVHWTQVNTPPAS